MAADRSNDIPDERCAYWTDYMKRCKNPKCSLFISQKAWIPFCASCRLAFLAGVATIAALCLLF